MLVWLSGSVFAYRRIYGAQWDLIFAKAVLRLIENSARLVLVGKVLTLTKSAAGEGHIIGQSALKHELMEVPMRRHGDLRSRRADHHQARGQSNLSAQCRPES
jgi:hypothetical protein